MKNIILCGFMGCGKTTVGENLKKKSGMNLIDTDAYIEETEGMTISKIFEKYGFSPHPGLVRSDLLPKSLQKVPIFGQIKQRSSSPHFLNILRHYPTD